MVFEMGTPVDAEEVDFEVFRENWSRYSLRDGVLLRIRTPVLKIFRAKQKDQFGRVGFITSGANLIDVICPTHLKGKPSADLRVSAADIISEVEFDPIKEEWAEYLLKDGTKIKVKPVVTKVSKTSKYSQFGDPVYVVDSQSLMKVEEPKVEERK
jgi:hypothetical protein